MFFLYNVLYTIGFALLSPLLLIRPDKYASGFKQRLGILPEFSVDARPTIWLHCVSVGETNAARPLVAELKRNLSQHRLVISTTTRTGQELAKKVFAADADAVFYFPFDFRLAIRRSLSRFRPALVLLMETEIWPNFIREASHANARVAIVNGRLSERSFKRYSYLKGFIRRVLGYLDLALMQSNGDASRIMALGLRASKVRVTGNLKFDYNEHPEESALTDLLRQRFGISDDAPLILAASTHGPEEEAILAAFRQVWKSSPASLPRLMIAPRHPARFEEVASAIERSGFLWARRSSTEAPEDASAEVILLDTIGELRSAYPLAEIVFVGGSLINHGGQSVFEPAAAGKAIVTGPHTSNFKDAVEGMLAADALIQLDVQDEAAYPERLADAFNSLLANVRRRKDLGSSALAFVDDNRGAAARAADYVAAVFPRHSG